LIGVPDIHHVVGMDVGRVHLQDAEHAVPVPAQPLEGRVGSLAVVVPGDHRLDEALVDGL
jgi:hypothetical protein